MKLKKIAAAVMAAALIFSAAGNVDAATRSELAGIRVTTAKDFRYWNHNSPTLKALTNYVEDVTNPKSRNFIPVEDRIAVFDLDGTLVCETSPSYFEWMLYLERALNDPTYQATPGIREYALKVKKYIDEVGIPNPIPGATEKLPADIDVNEASDQATVFVGMTLPEYDAYVQKFMETPAEGFSNLKRGEAFYLPMVEVVSYLEANKFKNFLVSGTDRQTLRVLTRDVLPIESDNIIGTDICNLASHQEGNDGLAYVYAKDDDVIRGGLVLKNIKMNKVSKIAREIGKQPVLSFGNSSGDTSMLNYCLSKNKYKSLSFALLCDDTEREFGSMTKADKMLDSCKKYGWIPVSMKNDFKTIYGENVKPIK